MDWLTDNFFWVLIVGGVLTLSMIQAVFAPVATIKSYFGEELASPAGKLLARNWGMLIAAGGAFLIVAAFQPELRPAALIFVGAGKLFYILLVLTSGLFNGQARTAVIIDGLMVILFALYLWATLT